MKLQLRCSAGVHKEMVTAVSWTPDNELYSMSDDNTIHRWDGSGDPAGKVWHVDTEFISKNGYVPQKSRVTVIF